MQLEKRQPRPTSEIGAAEAFAVHQAQMLRLAALWFGNDAAEDACCMMWLKAVRCWNQWRGECSLRTWLATIMRTEWIVEIRKRQLREPISVPMPDRDCFAAPAGFDVQLERRNELQSVLAMLSKRDRAYLMAWSERPDNRGHRVGQAITSTQKLREWRALQVARACCRIQKEVC